MPTGCNFLVDNEPEIYCKRCGKRWHDSYQTTSIFEPSINDDDLKDLEYWAKQTNDDIFLKPSVVLNLIAELRALRSK